MIRTLEEIREAMEKTGLRVINPWKHLPTSGKTFPDGAHYRVEISGIESTEIFEATVEEAENLGVSFHRSISLVRGSSLYTTRELEHFAQVASDKKVEVVITPGPRAFWDTGRQIATPEGILSGFKLRGNESMAHNIHSIMRCYDIGFRAYLVWDTGLLVTLKNLKEIGEIPDDMIFKISIFEGEANAAGVRELKPQGATTFNPIADLSPEMLAEMRAVTDLPMDIHIMLWDSMGGYNFMYFTPEIARVLSPCYFKMEPGPGFNMYKPWGSPKGGLEELGRFKMRCIRNIIELVNEKRPKLKVSSSDWKMDPEIIDSQGVPEDLRIPEYKYAHQK